MNFSYTTLVDRLGMPVEVTDAYVQNRAPVYRGSAQLLKDTDQDHERVFKYRWFEVFPPTPQELEEVLRRKNV